MTGELTAREVCEHVDMLFGRARALMRAARQWKQNDRPDIVRRCVESARWSNTEALAWRDELRSGRRS